MAVNAGQLLLCCRQGQNAPKVYHAPQEMTPEIAHIHVGRPHNGIVWMQSDLRPLSLYTVFSGAYFNHCRALITPTFGQPWAVNMSTEFDMLKKLKEVMMFLNVSECFCMMSLSI